MTLLLLLFVSVCQTSVHSRVSLTSSPSRFQYFEYEKVSLGCDESSSGDWRVWRYSPGRVGLSPCGSSWGDQTSSTCNMKTIKLSDAGVYWCQSKYGDSSMPVDVTVTGGSVILQSPVLPVMEGDDVTLHCETKNSSNLPADFYKDHSFIRRGPEGHMTIHHVSRSDEGLYKCSTSSDKVDGESLPSQLLMKDDSEPASLTASPDSSQLFEYEDLSLSCGDNSSFHGWRIFRSSNTTATSGGKISSCGEEWGTPTPFGCDLENIKGQDSSVYWCESPLRQRSNSLNIAVHDRPVILHSPVVPAMKGDNVTLRCRTKKSSSLPADFYKDGSFFMTGPAGHITIHHVSRSDEGLYKCIISSDGESPASWLSVRDPHGSDSSFAESTLFVLRVILHLVVFCPYCISTYLMVSIYRHRSSGRNKSVSMTTPPPSEYDDVMPHVTTEHHF